jgi:hypothetical protein
MHLICNDQYRVWCAHYWKMRIGRESVEKATDFVETDGVGSEIAQTDPGVRDRAEYAD